MTVLDPTNKHKPDKTFAGKLPLGAQSAVWQDIKVQFDLIGGRSRLRKFVTCLLTPGVQDVIAFRFGTWLIHQSIAVRLILHSVYSLTHLFVPMCWGIDIERGATIGPSLYIGHFGGINISGAATIGRDRSD